MEKKIRVRLRNAEDRSYDVIIGWNILDRIGRAVKRCNLGRDIFIITDRRVGRLYAQRVIRSLRAAGFSGIGEVRIAEGEASKTLDVYGQVLRRLHDFDRYRQKKLLILTLGGGVVGDLGGFVAGSYRRGVNYIQIPTSLLGQVDCGLGGKTAVNLKEAKNLIGLFYQPKLVYMDLAVLKTLDAREMRCGLAEVIKYGVIKDADLFRYVEGHTEQILRFAGASLQRIVVTCVKIKAGITAQDEKDEKDIRIILNFGHTIGHAVEAAAKYKVYKHGEAVAIGMLCAAEIACRLGLFSNRDFFRLEKLIKQAALATKIKQCSLPAIMSSMRHDKKFIAGVNRFVLPVAIGRTRIVQGIEEGLIKDVIRKRMVK